MEEMDAKCNGLFKQLDTMRQTPDEGGSEFMRILYELQNLTRERNRIFVYVK